MTSNYKIEQLIDSHDCETCGFSYAEGFVITLSDGSKIERIPHAYCFDSKSYSLEEAHSLIFDHLNVKVEFIEAKTEDTDD